MWISAYILKGPQEVWEPKARKSSNFPYHTLILSICTAITRFQGGQGRYGSQLQNRVCERCAAGTFAVPRRVGYHSSKKTPQVWTWRLEDIYIYIDQKYFNSFNMSYESYAWIHKLLIFDFALLKLAEFCLVKFVFPFPVAQANAGMSECNSCTRGEYAEEGVDDGGGEESSDKKYKNITCYAILCVMHDMSWFFQTEPEVPRNGWDANEMLSHRTSVHLRHGRRVSQFLGSETNHKVSWLIQIETWANQLQVLPFVRLVDVASLMIKKHRAVAKIVSEVLGMSDV